MKRESDSPLNHLGTSPLPPRLQPRLWERLKSSLGRSGQSEPAPHSTMVKSSSIVLLVGLLALWAELPSASGQNITKKEGVCPDTVVEAANCTEQCQADSDCEENLKCCQTSCGWSCQLPNVKPGSCPLVSGGIPLLGLCKNQCTVDSQCTGTMKCCINGCRKRACVRPNF
ncbi:WAP four-disulfide core domain protein 2-like [Malaclemys terrapin pileata]|uniref:WAP four-disulfide core domain protein 2-like n=2 Tax=Emydidae TaxID=8476 RepID=UPI0023A7A583|nr:WAP four-disulfide core domain protein 2-like [Malaclemys terrapin pileata]